MVLSRLFPLFAIMSLAIPFGLGWLIAGTFGGVITALIWAGSCRMTVLHHVAWSINSVCHVFGRQPYTTKDHSTNSRRPTSTGRAGRGSQHRPRRDRRPRARTAAPESFILTTPDDVTLSALRYGRAEADIGVVFGHGFTGSQPEYGLAVYTADFRGHGASGGLSTLGDQEIYDLETVLALVRGVYVDDPSMPRQLIYRHVAQYRKFPPDAWAAERGPRTTGRDAEDTSAFRRSTAPVTMSIIVARRPWSRRLRSRWVAVR